MMRVSILILSVCFAYAFSEAENTDSIKSRMPSIILEKSTSSDSTTAFIYNEILSIISPHCSLGTVRVKNKTGTILFEQYCSDIYINIPIKSLANSETLSQLRISRH